jgi:amidase
MAEHVRRRALSPAEIVDSCIERIERRNPSINAFVFKGFEDARSAAKVAEQAVMSGAATGPLHGVPSAIKDLFDFKPGWPFTFGGVRAMKDCVAQWHCIFCERVEKAGAILLGKTNSPTMGLRGTCDNYMFGPTRNPFDARKNAGGSSGGSAAGRRRPRPVRGRDGRWRIDPHSGGMVQRRRLPGVIRPDPRRVEAQRLWRRYAIRLRGADRPHG